jgi:hypothetical protein
MEEREGVDAIRKQNVTGPQEYSVQNSYDHQPHVTPQKDVGGTLG